MYIIHETSTLFAVATVDSDNSKTGPMTQIWIMSKLVHPVESRRTGHDATLQCQGCPYASNQGCYVSPLALMAIWRAFKAGSYSHLEFGTPAWNSFFDGASQSKGSLSCCRTTSSPMRSGHAGVAEVLLLWLACWQIVKILTGPAFSSHLLFEHESISLPSSALLFLSAQTGP